MAKRTPVTVQVLDDKGRPVANAVVAVEQGDAPFPEIAYETGADGRVRISLPPGRFRISASLGARTRGAVDVEHRGAGSETEIRIAPG